MDPNKFFAEQRFTRSRVRFWEIIADNLKKAGWSYGYVSAMDCKGRTIWVADAHRGDGNRFVVRADAPPRGWSMKCSFWGKKRSQKPAAVDADFLGDEIV